MATPIDIDVDWNTMDDTGLPCAFADEAADPSRIVPGAFVVAGRGTAIAVVEVVEVSENGVVHLAMSEGASRTCTWWRVTRREERARGMTLDVDTRARGRRWAIDCGSLLR